MRRKRDTVIEIDEGEAIHVNTGPFEGSITLMIEGRAPFCQVVTHLKQEQVEQLIEALHRH
jgi:hypothetical protein